METSLARIKPERKNAKRTRKNVRKTRRCKRIVPRRARSAQNKERYFAFLPIVAITFLPFP